MTALVQGFPTRLAALLAAAALALSQGGALAQQPAEYSQAELDRMLAPIALYPDPLLSQILMASTYPLEVVEAARWSRANRHLKGDDAVRAVADRDWDPSVKSLVAFPQVLERMDQNLEWTRSLGDAFLAQEPHVMDTVQRLRHKAHAAGNLRSDERLRVEQSGDTVVIAPADPRVIYVPYYDPWVVYGAWWWPAYPPVFWAPWPGYVQVHRPGVSVGFWWGAPIGISVGFFFGDLDWHHRHARVVSVHSYYYRPALVRRDVHVHPHHHVNVEPGHWKHNPHHRRSVGYRNAVLQQRYAAPERGAEARAAERRIEDRGRDRRQEARAQRGGQNPQPVAAPQQQNRPPQLQAQPQQDKDDRRQVLSPRERRDEARAEPRIENRPPERRMERPRPESRVERRPEPRSEPRVERRAEPRPEARVERRSEPQADRRAPEVRLPEARAERREPRHDARGARVKRADDRDS